MAIEWSSRLSVGVPTIDRQHQELISRINSLLDAMKQGKGDQEIGRLLKFLEDYVGTRLQRGREADGRAQVPWLCGAQGSACEFVRDFCRLKDEMASSQASVVLMIEIQRRVCDWTVQHIGKIDKVFGDYLRAAP